MNVLIVYAHPEPKSFDAMMKSESIEVLKDLGYAVQISDLYAMRFKSIVSPGDFVDRVDENYFDLRREQSHASRTGTYTPDILREQQKILWADFVIFQFPLWWYSVPAIMKGWLDRVLTYGFAYGEGHSLIGRRAMLVMTTGGPPRVFTPELRQAISTMLDHIQRHTLYFCGFEVLPPFAVYGAYEATPVQRERYMAEYVQILQSLNRIVPLEFDDE